METSAAANQQLKQLIKAALVEVLTERQDILIKAVWAAMEDYAFGLAIKEGMEGQPVSREEVFKAFQQAE